MNVPLLFTSGRGDRSHPRPNFFQLFLHHTLAPFRCIYSSCMLEGCYYTSQILILIEYRPQLCYRRFGSRGCVTSPRPSSPRLLSLLPGPRASSFPWTCGPLPILSLPYLGGSSRVARLSPTILPSCCLFAVVSIRVCPPPSGHPSRFWSHYTLSHCACHSVADLS